MESKCQLCQFIKTVCYVHLLLTTLVQGCGNSKIIRREDVHQLFTGTVYLCLGGHVLAHFRSTSEEDSSCAKSTTTDTFKVPQHTLCWDPKDCTQTMHRISTPRSMAILPHSAWATVSLTRKASSFLASPWEGHTPHTSECYGVKRDASPLICLRVGDGRLQTLLDLAHTLYLHRASYTAGTVCRPKQGTLERDYTILLVFMPVVRTRLEGGDRWEK